MPFVPCHLSKFTPSFNKITMSVYCTMCPGTEDTAANRMDRSLPFQRQMSEAHVNHLSEPVITKR